MFPTARANKVSISAGQIWNIVIYFTIGLAIGASKLRFYEKRQTKFTWMNGQQMKSFNICPEAGHNSYNK